MERKIGEIFEFGGELYQCVEGTCRNCSFYYDTVCKNITTIGNCYYSSRTDHKFVIFKKLEKVGEPFSCNYYGDSRLVMMQEYQLFDSNVIYYYQTPPMYITDYKHKRIAIEIKQNKEDMGEKKLNLKPFDLEAAKSGKPVCTRDGRKARIICFDKVDKRPIVALISDNGGEFVYEYLADGKSYNGKDDSYDLMMSPEKKEGWINVYENRVYSTKEEALDNKDPYAYCIKTINVSWEE